LAFSLGYIAAAGLAGGLQGAGEAGAKEAEEQQKNAMIALRDQRLSQLHIGEIQAASDIATKAMPARLQAERESALASQQALSPGLIAQRRAEAEIGAEMELRKPRILAPGATEVVPGAPAKPGTPNIGEDLTESGPPTGMSGGTPATPDKIFTAPIRTPDEQRKFYEGHANYYNALAEQLRAGSKDKIQVPTVKIEKNPITGDITNLVDEHSGAVGTVVEVQPPVEAKSHWLSPNEPAKPAVTKMVWKDSNGKDLPGGLSDLYPSMRKMAKPDTPGIIKGATQAVAPPDAQASTSASGTETPKPPAKYPDAQRAPDGRWYLKKGNSFYLVIE